jgi:hypothetical protein
MAYDLFTSDQFFIDVLSLPYRVRKDKNGKAYMINSRGEVIIAAGVVEDVVLATIAEMSAITRKHADNMATRHIRRNPTYNDANMPFYDLTDYPHRDQELKIRYGSRY